MSERNHQDLSEPAAKLAGEGIPDRLLAKPAACPWPANGASAALDPETDLVFPMHKSAMLQHALGDAGEPELQLFYGAHIVCFDEPETFAFGRALARHGRFRAADALAWQPGLGWSRVAELLGDLLAQGILKRAAELSPAEVLAVTPGLRAAPLPPGPATAARTWADDPKLMAELTGRALELGHLESVVPIFRVAHMALDAEGRQVGEANVFPKPLRMDIETRWQTCLFEGSRHQSDLPMNVTALKSMRAWWPQMMVMLRHIRSAYLDRFPEARDGWTVGHVERLATAVLALPTWQLMRAERPVANGRLHPALSCLFRVTDGLRMTMHQMLFVPFGEPTRLPQSRVTAAEIHDYAERNHSFHSEHGVCAGPRAMVEEFLSVILDGTIPADGLPMHLDAEVAAALCEIEPALDYGLLGLKAYAAVFSLWPATTRSYEAIAAALTACAAGGTEALVDLDARFQGHIGNVRTATYIGTEEWRVNREAVYADMYAQCVRGLAGAPPERSLPERLAPVRSPRKLRAYRDLRAALERFSGSPRDAAPLDALADAIFDFLLREQAVLRLASEAQREINDHLGRRQPRRPFDGRDIDLHNVLQGLQPRRLPYLLDELEAAFGLSIHIDGERLECRATTLAREAVQPHSEGNGADRLARQGAFNPGEAR